MSESGIKFRFPMNLCTAIFVWLLKQNRGKNWLYGISKTIFIFCQVIQVIQDFFTWKSYVTADIVACGVDCTNLMSSFCAHSVLLCCFFDAQKKLQSAKVGRILCPKQSRSCAKAVKIEVEYWRIYACKSSLNTCWWNGLLLSIIHKL